MCLDSDSEPKKSFHNNFWVIGSSRRSLWL
ncbi:hypothetical protein ANCCAN_23173 [Ancylostoma caninum]|uniref:Uncharacterized protein n=1 Tax=Ancylostoma caninum TaxID=29170 RepID=A0A368FJS3_ANCCA|nr:hypothetical protein ANCCAN_23173 [Ancylostoma caninum]